MSKTVIIIAIAVVGLGFILVLFKLLKKGAKFAKKLPTNFLIFFLVYAVLGLVGFYSKDQVAYNPILVGILLLLSSLLGGTIMAHHLYEKWEWSMAAGIEKKVLYLTGITLTSMFAFALVFIFSEHRGMPKQSLSNDIVWWLMSLIGILLLPLLLKYLHLLWNDIPKISQLKQIFRLSPDAKPPFIEGGGAAINFFFIIPFEYRSDDNVKSKIEVPLNKSLQDAFHFKLNEHNIVKRFAKKISLAEDNKRAKLYGWCFYKTEPSWWGWFSKKNYLDPKINVGGAISNGDIVYVEREKIWEQ